MLDGFKAVILVGGPSRGTRFRPLSLVVPKLMVPIGGKPMLEHHVSGLCGLQGSNLLEILVIGFYSESEVSSFLAELSESYSVPIR